jgi:2'-5' RNA ligase
MPAFEIVFHAIGSFAGTPSTPGRPQRRPLVLLGNGAGLTDLHRMLGAAMRTVGLRAAPDFAPHMTLAYSPTLVPWLSIEPIRFVVHEFELIHSELWLGRYNTIDRWFLQG